MIKGGEEGLGWVVEKKFGGETADCDIAAADGVKEGSVGRGAKGAGDIGGERSIFEVTDGWDGGVDREGRDTWEERACVGEYYIRWLWGWWGGKGSRFWNETSKKEGKVRSFSLFHDKDQNHYILNRYQFLLLFCILFYDSWNLIMD